MKPASISFIIPHKGREYFLQETIRSITLQDYDLSLIEVIIVTQNDKLSEETLGYQKSLTLSVYPRPVSDSIASLRNHGANQAKGEYLAFTDADIYLSPNWANCMLEALHLDEDRALVSAIQKNSQNANSVERIRTALNNINKDTCIDTLHGSNLFLNVEIFKLAGGFPAELQTCEDVFFTNKVSKYGNLYLTSKATFIHLGEDKDHAVMFKKEIWRGLSNLQSFKGRKVPIRELPSIFIPIALMILFISILLTLTQGFYILSILSAFLMIIPVIVYSLRLIKYAANQKIRLIDLLLFYIVYFSARSIGTYKGLYIALIKS